ncbi:ABC transporter substrate-binding protein [Photobacterium sp. TY1-4]|uniref:ABC transporter substrate-binding protein n=1 Tax=Photobacterium sp. TY1-4 TaxID=2899122 RepID=UPI0021C1623D|nr:ABC transporter substrate-binding protein [Photobacterium sp. TY1-4]UXI03454.1 ABC transporter substrate-binding protein [Photobacterium sp. TY1-4]
MKGLVALIMLASLMLSGCEERSEQQPEFRVGLIAPVSGQIPEVGRATVEAAELAVATVNQQGGLIINNQQYRVVLLTEDNQDNAEHTISAALRLINQKNVSAIIGPQASRNAIPAARYAEYAKIPLLSPWSTNPRTTLNKDWVFRVAYVDTFQGQLMAKFAYDELGARTAAVLYDVSSDYNRKLAEVFSTEFQAMGGIMAAFELYTRDAPNLEEQFRQIKSANPDILFLPNYYNEVPEQARQARAAGITTQLLGSDSWAQIPESDRDILEGAYFSAHYAVDKASGQALNFRARYREAYQRDPDDVAALTYDAFGLLFEAAKRSGSTEPQELRDALRTMPEYEGITGQIEFRNSGDPTKSAVLMTVKDGQFIFSRWIAPPMLP